MGLSLNFDVIKNQSTTFTSVNVDCASNELVYNNVVNSDDVTQVQFTINPSYLAVNLLSNGDFTTGTSGWTLSNMDHNSFLGMIGSSSDASCSATITPNNLFMPFGENAFMKVQVYLVANTHGCDITVGTNTYSLTAGQIGEFTFYGIFGDDTATNKLIKIESYGGTNHSFIINYVYATPIDYNYVFLVRNSTTNNVSAYYELWQYFYYTEPTATTPFRIIDNVLTWTVDWADLGVDNGCYQLEVCDPNINTNLQCGFPNQDFNFLEENSVDYDSGNIVAVFNGDSSIFLTHYTGLLGVFQIETYIAPTAGITYNYNVSFTNVDLSGGGITLTIGFAGDQDGVVITGNGSYSGSFVSDGGTCTFSISMSSNASCNVELARLYLADHADYSPNYISNGFTLTDGECATVELYGCSDTDYAFGLNFGSSDYTLKSRLRGKFTNAQYRFDRTSYEFSENANTRLSYFKREKTKVLKFDLLPEYMLDFLSAVVGLDHIYVDGVEYSASGEEFFTLSYSDELNTFGFATLFLKEKDTTIEKSACVEIGVGCADAINCIIDPETDECLIDPQTGDVLISL